MFNKEEYDTIVSECKKSSKLSSALSDLRKDSLEELSVVSHEIRILNLKIINSGTTWERL